MTKRKSEVEWFSYYLLAVGAVANVSETRWLTYVMSGSDRSWLRAAKNKYPKEYLAWKTLRRLHGLPDKLEEK